MLGKYIEVERVKKEVDFVNLSITTKSVNSKSKEDLVNTFNNNEFNLNNLSSNIQIHSDIVN